MLVANIRLEPLSDRPSPLQVMADMAATALNGAAMGVDLFAPYRAMLVLYGINRAVTKAMFR
jgi:hypothetical protein